MPTTYMPTTMTINDAPRTVLVIGTDELFTPARTDVIRQTAQDGDQVVCTDWFNAQSRLFRANLEQDGRFYSWMIVDRAETTTAVPAETYTAAQQRITEKELALTAAEQRVTALQLHAAAQGG